MKKKHLLIGALACLSLPVFSQQIKVYDTGRKWDSQFDALIEGRKLPRSHRMLIKSHPVDAGIPVTVTVNDTLAVKNYITANGYHAEGITEDLLVAEIPAKFIKTLSLRNDVLYINAPRKYRLSMNRSRVETGVSKAHAGEGLETPFTGKGVVVGIIDGGFEYRHPAFKNRVVRYGSNVKNGQFQTTAPASDPMDDVGHATHVANIAAGGKVAGVDYQGNAVGADLIMVSSELSNSAILSQTKAIKEYAESKGQPWVVNMSFGSILGPHDGTTEYDQTMSKLCGKGGIMVAAAGNEGTYKWHASGTIKHKDQPAYLYFNPDPDYNSNQDVNIELWSDNNQGKQVLDVSVLVVSGNRVYTPTAEQLREADFYFDSATDPYNNRQWVYIDGTIPNLRKVLKIPSMAKSDFLLKITAPQGEGFHAWINGDYTDGAFDAFEKNDIKAVEGDNRCMIDEGGASILRAVAVASYNNVDRFTSMNGKLVSIRSGKVGDISTFSTRGPHLSNEPKPTVASPGGGIVSALSKNSEEFDPRGIELVKAIDVDGEKFYYGIMSGTSMATPATTGIIALWLEANPSLTPEEVKEIMKATCRKDDYNTRYDENGWNATWGYGKIDAYAGLKKALEMAKHTGINETLNTGHPVTLNKEADAWKILFNNDESFAQINVYSLKGQLVKSVSLKNPRRGDEQIVDLNRFEPGVYVIRINTTASSTTRKVVVR